jgi:serine/threonine protein kinase
VGVWPHHCSLIASRQLISHALMCAQLDSHGFIRVLPDSHGRTPQPGTGHLASVLRKMPADFVDLVAGMLSWDPAQRATPETAMHHPWIAQGSSSAPESALASAAWSLPAHWDSRWASESSASSAQHGRGPLSEASNMQHGMPPPNAGKQESAAGVKRKGGIGMLLSMPGRRRS